MNKENQPKSTPENLLTWPFRKFGSSRWQTKALILGGLGLVIVAA